MEYKEDNSLGVGKKFIFISISLTIILNGGVIILFLLYVKENGIEKFIS